MATRDASQKSAMSAASLFAVIRYHSRQMIERHAQEPAEEPGSRFPHTKYRDVEFHRFPRRGLRASRRTSSRHHAEGESIDLIYSRVWPPPVRPATHEAPGGFSRRSWGQPHAGWLIAPRRHAMTDSLLIITSLRFDVASSRGWNISRCSRQHAHYHARHREQGSARVASRLTALEGPLSLPGAGVISLKRASANAMVSCRRLRSLQVR